MVIETIFTTKKHIKELDGHDNKAFGFYNSATKEYHIYLPYKASTNIRLHELAHCILGHYKEETIYTSQYLKQEIEAEEWACQKCCKTLPLDFLIDIARQVILWGERTNFTFNCIVNNLSKHGCTLTNKQRSYLWHEIRDLEKNKGYPLIK